MLPFNYDKSQFIVTVNGHHVSILNITGDSCSGDTPSARRNFKIAYHAMLDRMGLYGFLASPGHRMALEECLAVENPKIIVMSPCDCHALNNSAKLNADVNVLLVPEQSIRAFHITPTVEIYVDSHLERDDKFAVTQPRLFNDNDNWWMTPPPDFKVISFGDVLTTLGLEASL